MLIILAVQKELKIYKYKMLPASYLIGMYLLKCQYVRLLASFNILFTLCIKKIQNIAKVAKT